MKPFALIRGGRVVDVILADDAFIAGPGVELAGEGGAWVEVSDNKMAGRQRPGPGFAYNAGTRRFSPPE